MKDKECAVEDCGKGIRSRGHCYAHYMKLWRYGDAEYQRTWDRADLSGQRFGALVAIRTEGIYWICKCDCGKEAKALVGDLNRRSKSSCGDRSAHRREALVGYGAMHCRLRTDRGRAADYLCIDCGEWAAQWSYDHADPDGLMDGSLPYSLKSSHYDPRCVPCHKLFDLNR